MKKIKIEDNTIPKTNSTISKKSLVKQISNTLNNKTTQSIPRINELISDDIFQYYYRTHLNSKEYNEFKYFPDNDKLNILIDLFFFVNNKQFSSMNNEEMTTNDGEKNNIYELFDNLLILDSDYRRSNIIDKMKEIKLFTFNDENNYSNRFNEIMNKYKYDGENTINIFPKTEKNYNNSNYYYNNGNNTNTLSNNNYSPTKNYNTLSQMNYNNKTAVYNSLIYDENNRINPYTINNVYYKTNLDNIKPVKMGKLRQKQRTNNNLNIDRNNENNEIFYNTEEDYELISQKNDIINVQNNSTILKSKININKLRSNISSCYNQNLNDNEVIYNEPLIICQSTVDAKKNIELKKICNEGETNELIKKIYEFQGDKILFNKNEINKIGILLMNYIRLEQKYDIAVANLFFYKEKLNKLKESMKLICNKALDRINDSNKFISEYISQNQ